MSMNGYILSRILSPEEKLELAHVIKRSSNISSVFLPNLITRYARIPFQGTILFQTSMELISVTLTLEKQIVNFTLDDGTIEYQLVRWWTVRQQKSK